MANCRLKSANDQETNKKIKHHHWYNRPARRRTRRRAHSDTLILAAPVSSEAKLLQAIGRIVRPAQDKEIGDREMTSKTIVDLQDNDAFQSAP